MVIVNKTPQQPYILYHGSVENRRGREQEREKYIEPHACSLSQKEPNSSLCSRQSERLTNIRKNTRLCQMIFNYRFNEIPDSDRLTNLHKKSLIVIGADILGRRPKSLIGFRAVALRIFFSVHIQAYDGYFKWALLLPCFEKKNSFVASVSLWPRSFSDVFRAAVVDTSKRDSN
jgi:hypothetical protein